MKNHLRLLKKNLIGGKENDNIRVRTGYEDNSPGKYKKIKRNTRKGGVERMSVRYGDIEPGTPFNVSINGLKFRVGIPENRNFLFPKYDFKVRTMLKGEDYVLKFPDPPLQTLNNFPDCLYYDTWYSSSIISPVILTLVYISEDEIPGYQRYKVKVNGKNVKIWYNEKENLIHEKDFKSLSLEYPERKLMVAVGIDKSKPPKYPRNYNME